MLPGSPVSVSLTFKHNPPNAVSKIYKSWGRKDSDCLADPKHWPSLFLFFFVSMHSLKALYWRLRKSAYKPQKVFSFSWGLCQLSCCRGVILLYMSLLSSFSSPELQISPKFPSFWASGGNHPNSYSFIRQPRSVFLVKINCFHLWVFTGLSSSIKQISPTAF